MAKLDEMYRDLAMADQLGDSELAERIALEIQKAEVAPTHKARGRFSSLAQGATLGWGDEISSGVAATMAKALGDKRPIGEIYKDIHSVESQRQKEYRRENPGESLGLELAGGIGTGGVAAAKMLPKSLKGAKGVLARTGAVMGESALAGAGAADPGSRGQGAALGATFAGGMAGAGRLGRAGMGFASKNRVAQELQPDADTFIPLNIAADDSALGKFYRNFLGRAWGSGKKIARQSEELMQPSLSRLERAKEKADALPGTLKRSTAAIRAREQAASKAGKEQARQGLRQAKEDISTRVTQAYDDLPQFDQWRATAAQASLPSVAGDVRDMVTDMQPAAARRVMRDWWNKDGFAEVKERSFALTDELESPIVMINRMMEKDKDFALELGDVGEKVKKMAQQLQKGKGKAVIDGGDLMAIRNAFARPANRSETFKAIAQRGVANTIDDSIIRQAPEIADSFLEQKSAYRNWSIYRDAVKRSFNKRQGNFTEDDWLAAVNKNVGPDEEALLAQEAMGVQRGRAAFSDVEDAARQDLARARDTARQQVTEAGDQSNRRLRRSLYQLHGDAKKADAAARVQRHEDELRALQSASPLVDATGLSQLLTTEKIGQSAGVDALNLPQRAAAAVLAGSGISQGLASPTGQRIVAGQTSLQKEIARRLREEDELLRAIGRGVYRTTAQEAGRDY